MSGPVDHVSMRAATFADRPHQERPGGTEREHADHRVLQPAHLPIAVEPDAVGRVAVPGERDAVEGHPVATSEPPRRLGERRVEVACCLPAAEARLVDPSLVAEHPALLPRHGPHQVVVHLTGIDQQSAHDVHPRPATEVDPLDDGSLDERGPMPRVHGPDRTPVP